MAEGLQTADGQTIELDQAERDFHASMAAPSSDEPLAAPPPRKDPEAPFGRKADGTPRKRAAGPGRPRHDAPRSRAASSATGKPENPQDAAKRRTEGTKGLVQVGALVTSMLHAQTGNDAFLADTFTLTSSADSLAEAVTETCEVSPAFAKAVDKVTNVGPYAALFSVTLGIGAQLAANHRIGIGRMLGGKSPEDVIAENMTTDDETTAPRAA